MKFVVNRSEGETKSFTTPGTYTVTVASVKDGPLDRNGNPVSIMTLRGEQGEIISDRFQPKETQFWRLNRLVSICTLDLSDGEEFDFTRAGALTKFLERFVGQRINITIEPETYVKKDGSEGTSMRVRGMAKAPAVIEDAF